MTKTMHSALLAAVIASVPVMAVAQTGTETVPAPTANSAASEVGRNPPSATAPNGQRVEPSDKLWNNPRTVDEQPGTQPPTTDNGASTQSTHHKHMRDSYGRSSRGGNKTPSPADSGEQ
ncbi:hypothetical protein LU298_05070 [Komagataeibacter intermedius]|uniref:Serine/threonine protein kinase n=2 Tax=Komagataeibacter intermedius TaxID=66229 RepID=A0A0N1N680_9PROT|nr:hypothetical protein [Komagataeibacter intermedius]KPH88198.1 hypothetical protein GLUCOINTEAF2_0201793 [Komagataeibacter intermedius AF2]MCF3635871.1 hypothetical protein [Komagataeibacter intermedius]